MMTDWGAHQFDIAQLFFFSSRRRHTRSLCDWSSDVCSSDLSLILWQAGENNPVAAQRVTERDLSRMEPVATPAPVATMLTRTVPDSLLPCSTPMADDKPLPLDWPCWRVP